MPIWVTAMLAPKPVLLRGTFERIAGPSDIEGLAAWVSRSVEHERNNRLHWAACRIGELAKKSNKVSARAAGNRLVVAAMRAGLPKIEAMKTIDSGYQKSGLRFQP
jgi:hypothetical protein